MLIDTGTLKWTRPYQTLLHLLIQAPTLHDVILSGIEPSTVLR